MPNIIGHILLYGRQLLETWPQTPTGALPWTPLGPLNFAPPGNNSWLRHWLPVSPSPWWQFSGWLAIHCCTVPACVLCIRERPGVGLYSRCAENEPRLLEPVADITELWSEGRRTTVVDQAKHRWTSRRHQQISSHQQRTLVHQHQRPYCHW